MSQKGRDQGVGKVIRNAAMRGLTKGKDDSSDDGKKKIRFYFMMLPKYSITFITFICYINCHCMVNNDSIVVCFCSTNLLYCRYFDVTDIFK